jgi:hypothetical protein
VDGFNSAAGTYAATHQDALGSVGSYGGVGLAGGAKVGGEVEVPSTALTGAAQRKTYGYLALVVQVHPTAVWVYPLNHYSPAIHP